MITSVCKSVCQDDVEAMDRGHKPHPKSLIPKYGFKTIRQSSTEPLLNNSQQENSAETQTSQTAVDLERNMTPDSLSPPDTPHKRPIFARKADLSRFFDSNHDSNEKKGVSLMKTFLERRNYVNPNMNRLERSSFLQQISPLKNLFEGNKRQIVVKEVRDVKPKPEPVKAIHLDYLINEKTSPKPGTHRSNSFMMPTISSGNKQKIVESGFSEVLQKCGKRGRSVSPIKRVQGVIEIPKNIPYTVQNSDQFLSCCTLTSAVSRGSSMGESTVVNFEGSFCKALNRVRSPEWNKSLRGLVEIVEMCKSADLDLVFPHMTMVNHRLIELLKSPRSHVCRTACQAAGRLFEVVKDTRRPEFDEIVDILLAKTADSNKFIREDANIALDAMVTHIPTSYAVRGLINKGPDHKNPLVRTATARLMVCCVVIAGTDNILYGNTTELTRRRIVLSMVKFLNDKTLETRFIRVLNNITC